MCIVEQTERPEVYYYHLDLKIHGLLLFLTNCSVFVFQQVQFQVIWSFALMEIQQFLLNGRSIRLVGLNHKAVTLTCPDEAAAKVSFRNI
jgi:hypothetical protein